MITPRFTISQDSNTVTFKIRAPHCSLGELEICVEECVLIFACKPYYLRLNLPGRIVEQHTKSAFDADSGEFQFTYDKVIPGENFGDLDLITKFLCPKVEVIEGNRRIEVLSTENTVEVSSDEIPDLEYGFGMRGKYEFIYVSQEFSDIFELDPHEIKLEERKQVRLKNESKKFSVDHYICDLIENDEIEELIHLMPPWINYKIGDIKFTPEELDFMKDLPNIEYNLSAQQINFCLNSLLEILFSYCYDRRTTYFEGTCESGWTISKLCGTLCCFDGFVTPKEALVSSYRRSIIYPLYRNFELSEIIFKDLKQLLKLGEKFLIKCLIEIYNIFLNSDRYILNNLFIKDYIVYIMKWDKALWKTVLEITEKITINKNDLGLGLSEIENSLNDETKLCNDLKSLAIHNSNELDSDDSTESESDCTSTSDKSSSK